MRTLHSTGAIEDDSWVLLTADAVTNDALPEGDLLLPLARWRQQVLAGAPHRGRLGVWLENTDEPEELDEAALSVPVLGIRFPAFNDGRGLSTAVLLRTRRGYTGDLRAIGDVQLDQLSYMRRCGFSSFALAANADADAMREHLIVMSDYYQSSTLEPQPLFRRR